MDPHFEQQLALPLRLPQSKINYGSFETSSSAARVKILFKASWFSVMESSLQLHRRDIRYIDHLPDLA
jgi:hypothetical protein